MNTTTLVIIGILLFALAGAGQLAFEEKCKLKNGKAYFTVDNRICIAKDSVIGID